MRFTSVVTILQCNHPEPWTHCTARCTSVVTILQCNHQELWTLCTVRCTSVVTILQCNPPRTLQHVARESFLINVQLATAVRDRLQTQQPHFSHIRFKMGVIYRCTESVRMELESSNTVVQSVCCSSLHEQCNCIFMTSVRWHTAHCSYIHLHAVGVETHYGLTGRRFDSRWVQSLYSTKLRDRPWGPPSSLLKGCRGSFCSVKEAGAWSWPLSSIVLSKLRMTEVKHSLP